MKTDNFTEGFTAISNEFIKSKFSGNVTKVYLFLMSGVNEKRWGDTRTFPSWKAIKEGTGIKAKDTLSDCINELVEFGWITEITTRHDNSNIYFMAYSPNPNQDLITKRQLQKEARSKVMKGKIAKGKNSKKEETFDNWDEVHMPEDDFIPEGCQRIPDEFINPTKVNDEPTAFDLIP